MTQDPGTAGVTGSSRLGGLSIWGLRVSYDREVLHGIDLDVDRGEILSLVGPSGCGKTTLLRTVAGLGGRSSGHIIIDGDDVSKESPQKRKTGLVFQTPTLFPDLTVRENIAFGLDDAGMSDARRVDLVDIGMAMMNIVGLADRRPEVLSGGQGQRVSLARTIVRRPRVLLLDEPVAHVEVALRHAIHKDIAYQVRRMGMSALYVTHDMSEACTVGDRIAIMNDGKIVQIGTPRWVYHHPQSAFVARLMGVTNIFAVQIVERVGDEARLKIGRREITLPCDAAVTEGNGTAFIPPESIAIVDDGSSEGVMEGQIIEAGFARTHMIYDVETNFGTLVVHEPPYLPPRSIGDSISFRIRDGWGIGEDPSALA